MAGSLKEKKLKRLNENKKKPENPKNNKKWLK